MFALCHDQTDETLSLALMNDTINSQSRLFSATSPRRVPVYRGIDSLKISIPKAQAINVVVNIGHQLRSYCLTANACCRCDSARSRKAAMA